MRFHYIPEESPIIRLPRDPERVAQLEAKLHEYEGRLASFEHRDWSGVGLTEMWKAAQHTVELRMRIPILRALLLEGRVVTWEIGRKLFNEMSGSFPFDAFQKACEIIVDYCENGGKNITGDTGLPEVEVEKGN